MRRAERWALRALGAGLLGAGGGLAGVALLGGAAPASPAAPTLAQVLTLPNLVTLSGFAGTCAWLAGAHPGWAIAGLVADELDGRLARATGTTSEFGGLLDWTTDVAASTLILNRTGRLWAAPVVVGGQVALRNEGWRPPLGSARALLTLATIWEERDGRWRRVATPETV